VSDEHLPSLAHFALVRCPLKSSMRRLIVCLVPQSSLVSRFRLFQLRKRAGCGSRRQSESYPESQ
jgi:hypothetical protein